MIKAVVVWALALIFFVDSVFVTLRSDFSTGTFLMWLTTLALTLYGLFHRHIDSLLQRGAGLVFQYIFAAGLFIFAALFVFVCIGGHKNTAKGDEKAIVVLGAGIRGTAVGEMLRRRMMVAINAYEQHPGRLLVVSGGKGTWEKISEALAMKLHLLEHNVPENDILLEDQSISTRENLVFSKALLAEKGIGPGEPVVVVTTGFHVYRALQYAKMAGFTNVRILPSSMPIGYLIPTYMREILAIIHLWVFKK
ncbi:MAG: YdcF family protein [Oscillospiraceae bacterium]